MMVPRLILSDSKGRLYTHPDLKAPGFNGVSLCLPRPDEWIPLPQGSRLFYMPGHAAAGWDDQAKDFVYVKEGQGRRFFPVSAFMVPGFTRAYLPAAKKIDENVRLPLWPYTAAGEYKKSLYVCALKIDAPRSLRLLRRKEESGLKKGIISALESFPSNRLFRHLSRCALEYHCPNAQDLFLEKGEAPLPVSPLCNARCLGCLSFQESGCSVASHERISFVPTPQEVSEVALFHFKNAPGGIVSFGQGCEGEPLLQFPVLKESLRLIRQRTRRGTIHLNTNGFKPAHLKALAAEGLDSVRISLNAFNEKLYHAYYRPKNYSFRDVISSFGAAKKSGLFVSLNYLTFPGLCDAPGDVKRLINFLKKGYVDLLQLRNLSIDADLLLEKMSPSKPQAPVGMRRMVSWIKKECPGVRLGYFNIPKEKF